MSRKNYHACLTHILKWEGGYVDHPKDPGGATNHGITHKTLAAFRRKQVTKADVKALTIAEASSIYHRNYWRLVRGDDMPQGFDVVIFDGGVNSGPSRGVKWLQSALGVTRDGKAGIKTLTAARRAFDAEPVETIQRACAARMGFLRSLSSWSTFGRGWGRRVADTEATAVAMATNSPARLQEESNKAQTVKKKQVRGAQGASAGSLGTAVAGLPDWALYAAAAALVALAVVLAVKASHNARRAAAYRKKLKELTNG